MGVINGTPVDAATTNAAFLAKNTNDSTSNNLALTSANPVSGGSITNIQREFNSIDSFTGSIANSVFDQLPVWTNVNVGTSTDNLKERCEALTLAFATTGNVRAGSLALSASATSGAVTFTSAFASTNYAITCVLVNLTDAFPQFQPVVVTAKTTGGFTASWDQQLDTANYLLSYTAIANA